MLTKLLYTRIYKGGETSEFYNYFKNFEFISYKDFFTFLDVLEDYNSNKNEIRLGYRNLLNSEMGTLELFLYPIELGKALLKQKGKSSFKNEIIELEVELKIEGLVRGTLIPFDKKREELHEGIVQVTDFILDPFNKQIQLKEQMKSFKNIKNQLTLVKIQHL